MKLSETRPGEFSLVLVTGVNKVDEVIVELGHEPNGPFWDGVAERLVATEAPELAGRFEYDSEAGMFCVYGTDRPTLEALSALMEPYTTDAERIRALVAAAKADGFVFDD